MGFFSLFPEFTFLTALFYTSTAYSANQPETCMQVPVQYAKNRFALIRATVVPRARGLHCEEVSNRHPRIHS